MASPAACSVHGTMLSSPWCRPVIRTGATCRAAWLPTRRQRWAPAVAPAAELGGSSSRPATVQTAGTGAATLAGSPALAAAAVLLLGAAVAGPAAAFEIHAEPSNALSLPTWAVHTSSVLEWGTAMGLMWRYGEVSGNPRWKGMAWGMMPSLGSAMCACTWHLFYNSPDLEFLVALQAALTVVGNFTCWWAAYRIYQGAQQEQGA